MLNRKRLECDAANLRGRTLLDQLGIVDLAFFQCPPRLLRRVDRAGRAVLQSPCVIRMRVCEHDRAGLKTFKFSEPIKSAINHHVAAAIRHQQRSVHAMSARPRLDLTACAEKREFHRARRIVSKRRPIQRYSTGAYAHEVYERQEWISPHFSDQVCYSLHLNQPRPVHRDQKSRDKGESEGVSAFLKSRLHFSRACMVIFALSSFEIGQPSFALLAAAWNLASSASGTVALTSRCHGSHGETIGRFL